MTDKSCFQTTVKSCCRVELAGSERARRQVTFDHDSQICDDSQNLYVMTGKSCDQMTGKSCFQVTGKIFFWMTVKIYFLQEASVLGASSL